MLGPGPVHKLGSGVHPTLQPFYPWNFWYKSGMKGFYLPEVEYQIIKKLTISHIKDEEEESRKLDKWSHHDR